MELKKEQRTVTSTETKQEKIRNKIEEKVQSRSRGTKPKPRADPVQERFEQTLLLGSTQSCTLVQRGPTITSIDSTDPTFMPIVSDSKSGSPIKEKTGALDSKE